jgi:L-amino acid N-acyltransferase YncA
MIVRDATPGDAVAMADILNRIIAIGGTTAHETPKTPETVRTHYIDGPEVIAAVVAEAEGQVIGWQSVEHWNGEAHIGTFVRPGVQARGVGAALFALTCERVRAAGHGFLIASIRSDNVPGLAYYRRIGFVDIGHDPGFALGDGRVVGRVHRRFDLG